MSDNKFNIGDEVQWHNGRCVEKEDGTLEFIPDEEFQKGTILDFMRFKELREDSKFIFFREVDDDEYVYHIKHHIKDHKHTKAPDYLIKESDLELITNRNK